ncbi:hypothetical protein GEMRC1_013554 [Eukaryota sp. GEM-RC1]
MTDFSIITSNEIGLVFENSELFLDAEVVVNSSSISLIAVNSRVEYWTEFFPLNFIQLNCSAIFSNLNNEVVFDSFDCFHCQFLTKQKVNITNHFEVNYANIYAIIELEETVSEAMLSGSIRLSNHLLSHCPTIFIDLQLSTIKSDVPVKPFVHCYSDVFIQNSVSLLNVDVDFNHNILLLNASLQLDQDLIINHKLSGHGVIESNVFNYGLIIPDKKLEFLDSLYLSTLSNLKLGLSLFDHQISIVDDVSLSGILQIEVDLTHDILGGDRQLITASTLSGNFDEFNCNCNSIMYISYTFSSLIASVNDYIVDLN